MNTAPLEKVGSYNDFSLLIKDLRGFYKKIQDSTIQNDELGAIVYFVEKAETSRVLTMAKIETKESIALLMLIKTLRNFWSNHENIKTWNKESDKQYNAAFNYYTKFLSSLNLKDYEYYFKLADATFTLIKDDLDLYEKLKFDIPAFFINILKSFGEPADAFISSTLTKPSYAFDTEDAPSPKVEDNEEIRKTEEDAIDRLLKNEHIK